MMILVKKCLVNEYISQRSLIAPTNLDGFSLRITDDLPNSPNFLPAKCSCYTVFYISLLFVYCLPSSCGIGCNKRTFCCWFCCGFVNLPTGQLFIKVTKFIRVQQINDLNLPDTALAFIGAEHLNMSHMYCYQVRYPSICHLLYLL